MHIAFNTYSPFSGGVRSYIVKLATLLPAMYPNTHYTIFISPQVKSACDRGLPNVDLVVFKSEERSTLERIYWEQVQLPLEMRRRNVDLLYTFFATDILFSPCPTLIRIGNMAPYDPLAVKSEKQWKGRFRLHYLRWMSWISTHTSDGVIVQSEFAGDELVAKHRFPKHKVNGLNRGFDPSGIEGESIPRADLPQEYLLCVSHLSRYKMLLEVVDGYAKALRHVPTLPPLLIAGGELDKAYANELKQHSCVLNLQKHIRFLGNVPRNELESLISNCVISIFSSLVETYPSTLIEQMCVGTPLIVSNRGVMPAFCADSALYYDPTSSEQLSQQVLKLYSSNELRQQLIEASLKRMGEIETDWNLALQKRQQLFERVVSRSNSHQDPTTAKALSV